MAMNRETKRMLQRQGQVDADGETTTRARNSPPAGSTGERTKPLEFLREVRSELTKVAWPTKAEVINYSIIVFVVLVVLTIFIAAVDWLVGDAILRLYKAS